MNSDTQQITVCIVLLIACVFCVSSCEAKKIEAQTKVDVASAEAGLEQKCDATTGHRTIWVKPRDR